MPPESHFLSDVHLPFESGTITRRFVRYLSSLDPSVVREVFLLGDIFHYWISRSSTIRRAYADVLDALETASRRGITIHFFPGNRDFLLTHGGGPGIPGVTLHPDPEMLTCGERRIYLSHGDELCVGDTAYMRWKKVTRSPFVIALFNHLPESWRLRAVDRLSHASREKGTEKTPEIPVELYRRILRRGADVIIHGHLHGPAYRKHEYPPGEVFVLDAWDVAPNVLVYDHDSDEFTVRRLNDDGPNR